MSTPTPEGPAASPQKATAERDAPVRTLRGKGVLRVGNRAPQARDLKPYLHGEADDAAD